MRWLSSRWPWEIVLAVSAFLSSTLMPGGSEAILVGAVIGHPRKATLAWLIATSANALGSMTSFVIGSILPVRKRLSVREAIWHARLERWGSPLLFFAWVPLIGDFLPLAAGWLRLSPLASFFWIVLGKGVRYAILLALTLGYIA